MDSPNWCTATSSYRHKFQAALENKRGPLDPVIISAPNELHYNTPETGSRIRALITVPSYDVILLDVKKGGWVGTIFFITLTEGTTLAAQWCDTAV